MSLDDFVYRLYYVPEFDITPLKFRRNERDRELMGFVATMVEHMTKFGVRYPIGAHMRASGIDIRPGKCRVTAAQRMGWKTLPAIVADYTRRDKASYGWELLAYDCSAIQDRFFHGSDSVVEIQRRAFSIKKTKIIRQPGVEDDFSRELRLTK
jgi:hypothetical protein